MVNSGQLNHRRSQSSSGSEDQRQKPLSKTQELIDVTNKDLRFRGHKASLEIVKDTIVVRGTFPNGDGTKTRKRISTGLKAAIKSVATAENRLLDLLTSVKNLGVIPETLPWENKKTIQKGYPKIKAIEAIKLLKDDFFNVKTVNPKSRMNTWGIMQNCFNKLDSGAYITTDYLIAILQKEVPHPVTGVERPNFRVKLHQHYKRLGKFISLPDIDKIDKVKAEDYKPKKRDIPVQKDLLELAVKSRSHPKYGWLTAAMIVYGCRPSETLSLTPNKNGTATCFTLKRKKGLPIKRTALALPSEYVEKLDLYNISRELEFKKPEDFDPVEAKRLTEAWGKWLQRQKPDLKLYDCRHGWATRSIQAGVPSALAAKCLGHSIKVFEETYLQSLNENDIATFAAKAKL